jgi:nicotinamide-nucleotide amidase
VKLVLHEEWLERMRSFFTRRGRTMSENNVKQAMLPEGAEFVDNPVGTACGFAITIGRARFYFTPGVPRELRRMLENEILPRLLAMSSTQTVIRLKRFHSYGLGESHVDALLNGVESLAPAGSVKLGFRAHYPQLETKLTIRGVDEADVKAKLAPVEAEIHRRIGNYIMAEDDATLEGVVLAHLCQVQGSLAVVETFTGGQIAARVAPLSGAEAVFRRGLVARHIDEVAAALGMAAAPVFDAELPTAEFAEQVAQAARVQTGATHALAVIVAIEDGEDRIDLGGTVCIAVATANDVASRRSRLAGGRDWVRLGAVEMGLDSLRRYLQGLPVREPNDFEKVDR